MWTAAAAAPTTIGNKIERTTYNGKTNAYVQSFDRLSKWHINNKKQHLMMTFIAD